MNGTEEALKGLIIYEVSEEEYMDTKVEEEAIGDLTYMEFSSVADMVEELEYQGFTSDRLVQLSRNRYGSVLEVSQVKRQDGTTYIGAAIGAR